MAHLKFAEEIPLQPGHTYVPHNIIFDEYSWKLGEESGHSHLHIAHFVYAWEYKHYMTTYYGKEAMWRSRPLPKAFLYYELPYSETNCIYCALDQNCPDVTLQNILKIIDSRRSGPTGVDFDGSGLQSALKHLHDTTCSAIVKPAKK